PENGGTNIVISYHLEDEEKYSNYFDQLETLTNEQLTNYLNFLIIEYTENVFFNPGWIESLTESEKNSILDSFQSSIFVMKRIDLINAKNYYKFDLFNNDTF
ncbi:hypothetical protein ACFUCS_12195, partial [Peribacillus frigoritolerans]